MESSTIAVSSCALFKSCELEQEAEGVAFPFVKALNKVNQQLRDDQKNGQFKIVLITAKSQEQVRMIITTFDLQIDQICEITAKKTVLDHLKDIKPVLYLSTDPDSVKEVIRAGIGAATMFQRDYTELSDDMLRVAFDGDAVLFSDESERVFDNNGLAAFEQNESDLVDQPLAEGPLIKFSKALDFIQKLYKDQKCPIRTYLVTSRSAASPGIRALKSLQALELDIDEAFFLKGAQKGPVLKAINPHIFFDDQMKHVDGALNHGVIGAHVPFGVRN